MNLCVRNSKKLRLFCHIGKGNKKELNRTQRRTVEALQQLKGTKDTVICDNLKQLCKLIHKRYNTQSMQELQVLCDIKRVPGSHKVTYTTVYDAQVIKQKNIKKLTLQEMTQESLKAYFKTSNTHFLTMTPRQLARAVGFINSKTASHNTDLLHSYFNDKNYNTYTYHLETALKKLKEDNRIYDFMDVLLCADGETVREMTSDEIKAYRHIIEEVNAIYGITSERESYKLPPKERAEYRAEINTRTQEELGFMKLKGYFITLHKSDIKPTKATKKAAEQKKKELNDRYKKYLFSDFTKKQQSYQDHKKQEQEEKIYKGVKVWIKVPPNVTHLNTYKQEHGQIMERKDFLKVMKQLISAEIAL